MVGRKLEDQNSLEHPMIFPKEIIKILQETQTVDFSSILKPYADYINNLKIRV